MTVSTRRDFLNSTGAAMAATAVTGIDPWSMLERVTGKLA